MFISALCKVQTVNYERLALSFESSVSKESSLRRIQRFFAGYVLDHDLIAKLIFKLLPKKEKYELTMDRTNWKFGKTNINILVIGIVHHGVAFPLLLKILDKFGNSNTLERIELLNQYNELFGFETIDVLVADREFVGSEWLDYLNTNEIAYHIRIRENFDVFQTLLLTLSFRFKFFTMKKMFLMSAVVLGLAIVSCSGDVTTRDDAEVEDTVATMTCAELQEKVDELTGKEVTIKAISWGNSATKTGDIKMTLGDKKLEGMQQSTVVVNFTAADAAVADAVKSGDEVTITATVGGEDYGAVQLNKPKIQ